MASTMHIHVRILVFFHAYGHLLEHVNIHLHVHIHAHGHIHVLVNVHVHVNARVHILDRYTV